MRKDILTDHIGVLREVLRKYGKRIYYYYAPKAGQLLVSTNTMWYENINDGAEVLEFSDNQGKK
jgi:hypothetical protein